MSFKDETGMGTLEVLIIMIMFIGLGLLFKNQIIDLISWLFSIITG